MKLAVAVVLALAAVAAVAADPSPASPPSSSATDGAGTALRFGATTLLPQPIVGTQLPIVAQQMTGNAVASPVALPIVNTQLPFFAQQPIMQLPVNVNAWNTFPITSTALPIFQSPILAQQQSWNALPLMASLPVMSSSAPLLSFFAVPSVQAAPIVSALPITAAAQLSALPITASAHGVFVNSITGKLERGSFVPAPLMPGVSPVVSPMTSAAIRAHLNAFARSLNAEQSSSMASPIVGAQQFASPVVGEQSAQQQRVVNEPIAAEAEMAEQPSAAAADVDAPIVAAPIVGARQQLQTPMLERQQSQAANFATATIVGLRSAMQQRRQLNAQPITAAASNVDMPMPSQ